MVVVVDSSSSDDNKKKGSNSHSDLVITILRTFRVRVAVEKDLKR